jgi:hypothetical protein
VAVGRSEHQVVPAAAWEREEMIKIGLIFVYGRSYTRNISVVKQNYCVGEKLAHKIN